MEPVQPIWRVPVGTSPAVIRWLHAADGLAGTAIDQLGRIHAANADSPIRKPVHPSPAELRAAELPVPADRGRDKLGEKLQSRVSKSRVREQRGSVHVSALKALKGIKVPNQFEFDKQ